MPKLGNIESEKALNIKIVTNCIPLKKLAENNLLFFLDNTPDDNSTGISEQESIEKFTNAYNNLNDLSKTYVNTLTQILINTRSTSNSFEGVIFSSFPNYIQDGSNLTRIDCYDPETQKLHLCLADNPKVLERVLKAEVEAITVFQHEETHAIDDNYPNISLPNSIIKITNYFLENPTKKATIILTLSSNIISKKTALHQNKTILEKEYLDPYIEKIANSNKNTKDKVTFNDIHNYYDESKLSQDNDAKPKAKYTPLLEFVTFHGEKIFEYLKSSKKTEEFKQKYQENLDNFCNQMPGTKEDKQLALELIKVTSEDFLQKVIDTLPTQNISDQEKALKSSLQCITPALIKSIEQCKEVQQNKDKPSLSSLKPPTSKSSNNPIQTPKAKIDLSNLSTNQDQTLQSAKKVLKNNSALTKRKTSTPKQNNLSKTNEPSQGLDNDSSLSSVGSPTSTPTKRVKSNKQGSAKGTSRS